MMHTDLHEAAFLNDVGRCEEILEALASNPKAQKHAVNSKNENGATPLHLATCNRGEACCALLLKYGADVHAVDEDGATPLHIAAWSNCESICTLLLNHGADSCALDSNEKTPFDIAQSKGFEKLLDLLDPFTACTQSQIKPRKSSKNFKNLRRGSSLKDTISSSSPPSRDAPMPSDGAPTDSTSSPNSSVKVAPTHRRTVSDDLQQGPGPFSPPSNLGVSITSIHDMKSSSDISRDDHQRVYTPVSSPIPYSPSTLKRSTNNLNNETKHSEHSALPSSLVTNFLNHGSVENFHNIGHHVGFSSPKGNGSESQNPHMQIGDDVQSSQPNSLSSTPYQSASEGEDEEDEDDGNTNDAPNPAVTASNKKSNNERPLTTSRPSSQTRIRLISKDVPSSAPSKNTPSTTTPTKRVSNPSAGSKERSSSRPQSMVVETTSEDSNNQRAKDTPGTRQPKIAVRPQRPSASRNSQILNQKWNP